MRETNRSSNKRVNSSFRLVNFATAIAFIVLSVYFLSQTVRSVGITRQKLDIFDRAKQEVGDLRVNNVRLILMSERVETEEYIEEEARNRLNYAKDGETLFIIPEEMLVEEEIDQYINTFSYGYKEVNNSGMQNIQLWRDFFINGI